MFCARCGKPVEPWDWHCPACRRSTPVLQRHLLAAVMVALSFLAFSYLKEALETWNQLTTGLSTVMPWFLQYAYAAGRLISLGAVWVVAAYALAAVLLRKRAALFGSGRLAIWLAGIFLLAILGIAMAGAVAGATQSPDYASHARFYRNAYLDGMEKASVHGVVEAEERYRASQKSGVYGCDLDTIRYAGWRDPKARAEFDILLACGDARGKSYRVLARPVAGLARTTDRAYCADERGTLYSTHATTVAGAPAEAAALCLREGQPVN